MGGKSSEVPVITFCIGCHKDYLNDPFSPTMVCINCLMKHRHMYGQWASEDKREQIEDIDQRYEAWSKKNARRVEPIPETRPGITARLVELMTSKDDGLERFRRRRNG